MLRYSDIITMSAIERKQVSIDSVWANYMKTIGVGSASAVYDNKLS